MGDDRRNRSELYTSKLVIKQMTRKSNTHGRPEFETSEFLEWLQITFKSGIH